MARYEYKVVPAPAKGQKVKGVKTAEGRFALSVQDVLNEMGAAGWEYQRAELLPSEERSGLTGSTTNWRNVLVFRRPAEEDADTFQPRLLDAPGAAAPTVVTAPSVVAEDPPAPAPLDIGAVRTEEEDATQSPPERTPPTDGPQRPDRNRDTQSVIRGLRGDS